MIKDITENVNTMRLKITFALNHNHVSEAPFLVEKKEKVYLTCILLILNLIRQGKDEKQQTRAPRGACFQSAATALFSSRLSPLRGGLCSCRYREV